MKTALLGGSFNPLHLGHLSLADEAISAGYERVILIPAHVPAHKEPQGMIDASYRYEMTRAAAEAYGFEVSDCEIVRGGVSYTIDTVRLLSEELTTADRLGVIVGEDLLPGLDSWKESELLFTSCDLLLASRGCERRDRDDISYRRLDNPDFPVSSSEIRARIRAGRPYRFLVPPEVYAYIERNGLYRTPEEETQ